jgi:hypothetical protein
MKLWFSLLRMCVCMHSRLVENHPIRILEHKPLISKVVLSHEAESILHFRFFNISTQFTR